MSKAVFRKPCVGRRSMSRSLLFSAIVAATIAVPAVYAQESSGGVYGAVDMQGRIAAAQVVIRNLDTNATQIRKPDASVKYSIAGLSPGKYEIVLRCGEQRLASTQAIVRPGSYTAVAPLADRRAAATKLGEVRVSAAGINNAADNTAPIDVSTPQLARQ